MKSEVRNSSASPLPERTHLAMNGTAGLTFSFEQAARTMALKRIALSPNYRSLWDELCSCEHPNTIGKFSAALEAKTN